MDLLASLSYGALYRWAPSSIALLASISCFTLVLAAIAKRRSTRLRVAKNLHPAQAGSKNPPRQPGHWIPSPYARPKPAPYPDWSIETTKPLPYRPFRYGTYYITMGLRNMPWDEWIELDNRYLEYHEHKATRIRNRGAKLNKTAPEGFDGAVELLEEFASYLPERYPNLFRRTNVGLDNLVTGESFNIVERPLQEDPMQIAGRLVQDDLAIMFERGDGQYYLLAGSIILPGFWRLEDKFGMPLAEIHTSGNVPGFKEKLQKGMENLFRRMTPDKPVIRHNYFFQVDDNLAWSSSLGPEDATPEKIHGWAMSEEGRPIGDIMFRSERQTLRRLPRTGGVVFTIRTYFEKVVDIAEEPGVPGRLASGTRGWPESVDRYKGKEKWGDTLLEYLDRKHEEQKMAGLVPDSGEHAAYPY